MKSQVYLYSKKMLKMAKVNKGIKNIYCWLEYKDENDLLSELVVHYDIESYERKFRRCILKYEKTGKLKISTFFKSIEDNPEELLPVFVFLGICSIHAGPEYEEEMFFEYKYLKEEVELFCTEFISGPSLDYYLADAKSFIVIMSSSLEKENKNIEKTIRTYQRNKKIEKGLSRFPEANEKLKKVHYNSQWINFSSPRKGSDVDKFNRIVTVIDFLKKQMIEKGIEPELNEEQAKRLFNIPKSDNFNIKEYIRTGRERHENKLFETRRNILKLKNFKI